MAEDTSSRELLENIVERLDHLERILQTHTARLYAVEQRLGIEARPRWRTPQDDAGAPWTPRDAGPTRAEAGAAEGGARPFEPRADGARQQQHNPPRDTEWGGSPYETPRAESERREAPPQSSPPHAPAPKRDIESLIGGSWFLWVGILAIIVAASLFLKFAFDNEWIGP